MAENPDCPCIVVGPYGAMGLTQYNGEPRAGVLAYGDHVTLFPNRRRARRALDRSAAYAIAENLPWDVVDNHWKFSVVNVKPPEL